MVTETSLVSANVRLREWALQIKDCQSRPQDMKVEDWCKLHGLTKSNYYYRLRRVREAMLDVMDQSTVPEFVELTPPAEGPANEKNTSSLPVAAVQLRGNATIQLSEHASEDFLRRFLRALQSC